LIGANSSLEIFNRQKEIFTPYTKYTNFNPEAFPENIQTNALYEDMEGNLWIGTWLDGLICYNPAKKKFCRYLPEINNPTSISSTKITTIFEGSQGWIWVGTHSGGLNRFDKKKDVFTRYTTQDGLPNDVVFSILEDAQQNIWVSTMKGLARFNRDTEIFRIYDETDGIIHNQFNWRAGFKDKTA